MGDEADALEGQSDEGAYESMREHDWYARRDARIFRRSVQAEVSRQINHAGVRKPSIPRGVMVERTCKCGCGVKFQAREADVKRGWGNFSSKSCAALFKDRCSKGINREQYGF